MGKMVNSRVSFIALLLLFFITVVSGAQAVGSPALSLMELRNKISADSEIIRDARTMLKLIEPSSANNAMVYWDQNQVNFRSRFALSTLPGTPQQPNLDCATYLDAKCNLATHPAYDSIYYDAIVGNCLVTPISICVNSFDLVKEDGSVVKGTPTERTHPESKGWPSTFNAKTNLGYPGSDEPWIWNVDGVDYLVMGILSGGFSRINGIFSGGMDKNFRFSIYPIKKYFSPDIQNGGSEDGCLTVDAGVCYVRVAFKTGLRFKLDLRLPKNISGWLNGRLNKPSAYLEDFDDDYADLIVEAGPLEEIVSAQWLPMNEVVTQHLIKSGRSLLIPPGQKNLDTAGQDPDNAQALGNYLVLSKENLLKDSALTTSLAWRLQTTTGEASPEIKFRNSCTPTSGVQGIVSSNAAVYEPGPPKFDTQEVSLAYKVAAPHFKEDGKTENSGRYGFTMREDLIKCLYGLNSLPSTVQVEITYGEVGTLKVATIALRTYKNWVYLNAENFTFSSPTIRIKLLQGKSGQPNQLGQPNQPNGQATINCVKGSDVKTVTGVLPNCPAGYQMQGPNGALAPLPNQPNMGANTKPKVLLKPKQVTITCLKGKLTKKVTQVNPKCPAGYKQR